MFLIVDRSKGNQMKKSNKSFSISALFLVLISFMFASTNVAFAAEEKKAEDAATTTDADASKEGDDKKKKKKKGDGEEEPECE